MTLPLSFSKMHGLGNDFIIINDLAETFSRETVIDLAKTLCDRHFGIGADGLVLIRPSSQYDFRMQIINPDGSEPQMCGNAIRCVARYVYEKGLTTKTEFSIETLAGEIRPKLILTDPHAPQISVDMGPPILERAKIPVSGPNPTTQVLTEPLHIPGMDLTYTAVSMGNPHAVIYVDNLDIITLEKTGPQVASLPLFPEGINVEFVERLSKNEVKMTVWERGAGATLACGTGACALVVAGILTQELDRQTLVHLPGGDLQIHWQESNNHVIMTGPATWVFDGTLIYKKQGV